MLREFGAAYLAASLVARTTEWNQVGVLVASQTPSKALPSCLQRRASEGSFLPFLFKRAGVAPSWVVRLTLSLWAIRIPGMAHPPWMLMRLVNTRESCDAALSTPP